MGNLQCSRERGMSHARLLTILKKRILHCSERAPRMRLVLFKVIK